jgi:drug/metabolite transporter (DMT)-like permease
MIYFLLGLTVFGTVAGDLFKAKGMRRLGELHSFHPVALAQMLGRAAASGWMWACLASCAISFFGFMALVSVADLSFAVLATASGYVVETVLARVALRETISPRRWCAVALVTAGVVMVGG